MLAWRRRWPEAVLGVQGATAFAFVLAGWPAVGLGPAVVAGVHGLGSVRDRRRAVPVLLAAIASMAVVVTISDARADTVVANGVVLGIAWWLGDRNRRAQERAIEAERSSDAQARRAVADERLRIARELHDIVAHALSVIAVQAGTGRVVLDRDPETTRAALGSIETQSRGALDEMRRLLAVLRSEDDVETGPLGPAPGLDQLEALVAATVASGLPVEVRIEGDRRPLPAGAELATYRIVQEALTNVRRHAVSHPRRGEGGLAARSRRPGDPRRRPRPPRRQRADVRPRPGRDAGARQSCTAAPSRPVTDQAAGSGSRRTSRAGRRVIRVAVADDQPLVRAGFGALVTHADDLELVG